MKLRTRLTLRWVVCFILILLPVFLVSGLFFFDRMLNQIVLAVLWVLSIVGTFVAVKTVETMRGLADDDKTLQWLDAARRRDAAAAEAEARNQANEKLLDELRGRKDARLPKGCDTPGHWRRLDDAGLQSQVVRLLKKLGRRVQRTGDSAHRGFDLVIDNNAVAQCSADSKRNANKAANDLLTTLRGNPTCTAAILVWPQGFSARTRYLAQGTNLILLDAENLARLVKNTGLA
jgi:hypothetical protein